MSPHACGINKRHCEEKTGSCFHCTLRTLKVMSKMTLKVVKQSKLEPEWTGNGIFGMCGLRNSNF
jgi:hypothetical protein